MAISKFPSISYVNTSKFSDPKLNGKKVICTKLYQSLTDLKFYENPCIAFYDRANVKIVNNQAQQRQLLGNLY